MQGKTILLVDDHADQVDLTTRALQSIQVGNKVVVARNGTEALAYLHGDEGSLLNSSRPAGEMPVMVLLDLDLPGLGGLEVLRRIRSHPRTAMLPVVVLTASREEHLIAAGYRSGANGYICKPADFLQFADTARQLGMFWLMLNEPPPQLRGA
jgi:CheY-like chemotaxis protein